MTRQTLTRGSTVRLTRGRSVMHAVVHELLDDDRAVVVVDDAHMLVNLWHWTIERDQPPWADHEGTVVVDTTGVAWQRRADGWHSVLRAGRVGLTYPELEADFGPLTVLREGDGQ